MAEQTLEQLLEEKRKADEAAAALAKRIEELQAASRNAALEDVKKTIAQYGFSAAELGIKTAGAAPKEKTSEKKDDAVVKVKQVRPVYYNVQAVEGEKICRDRGQTFPNWYKNATKEGREVFKVTDHKKAHELLLKYGKPKDARAYYDCFLSPSQPNPAV